MAEVVTVQEAINKLETDLKETDKMQEPITYRDIENTIGWLKNIDEDKIINMPEWGDITFYHECKEIA